MHERAYRFIVARVRAANSLSFSTWRPRLGKDSAKGQSRQFRLCTGPPWSLPIWFSQPCHQNRSRVLKDASIGRVLLDLAHAVVSVLFRSFFQIHWLLALCPDRPKRCVLHVCRREFHQATTTARPVISVMSSSWMLYLVAVPALTRRITAEGGSRHSRG